MSGAFKCQTSTVFSVSGVTFPVCPQTPPTQNLQMFSSSWTTTSQLPWQGTTAVPAPCLSLGPPGVLSRKPKLFFTANSVNSPLATSRASDAIIGTSMAGRSSSSAKTAPFTQALSKWHEDQPWQTRCLRLFRPSLHSSLHSPTWSSGKALPAGWYRHWVQSA